MKFLKKGLYFLVLVLTIALVSCDGTMTTNVTDEQETTIELTEEPTTSESLTTNEEQTTEVPTTNEESTTEVPTTNEESTTEVPIETTTETTTENTTETTTEVPTTEVPTTDSPTTETPNVDLLAYKDIVKTFVIESMDEDVYDEDSIESVSLMATEVYINDLAIDADYYLENFNLNIYLLIVTYTSASGLPTQVLHYEFISGYQNGEQSESLEYDFNIHYDTDLSEDINYFNDYTEEIISEVNTMVELNGNQNTIVEYSFVDKDLSADEITYILDFFEVVIEEDIIFIIEDGEATVVGHQLIGDNNHLVLPATVNQYPVTSINDNSLRYSNLESIYISEFVEHIDFTNLYIQNNLHTIEVDTSNQYFASDDGILYDKDLRELIFYPRGKTEDSLIVLDSVQVIKERAFYNNNYLITLSFAENSQLTTIEDNAFIYSNIVAYNFPASLENLNIGAFTDSYVSEITLDENNTNFTFQDGVLYNSDLTELIIYTDIDNRQTFEIPASVIKIGERAFNDASYLIQITFEENSQLEIIGEYAFRETSIQEIIIPASVKTIMSHAFGQARNLQTVTFEDGSLLETIGSYAFERTNITEFIVPEFVSHIGNSAFYGNYNLTSISVDPNNIYYESIDEVLFNEDITQLLFFPQAKAIETYMVPATVERIVINAFKDTSFLNSVVFESNSVLHTIEIGSFANSNIQSIVFPASLITIESNAFYYTSYLTSVTFEENSLLERIGGYAFGSSGIETITIPKSVIEIGGMAFSYTRNLTSLTFETGININSINSRVFFRAGINQITIPASVESIGERAFQYSKLQSITFEEDSQINEISKLAFASTKLVNITIPETVTKIADDSFHDCSNLESITVDSNNENYQSIDGVLYNKEVSEILVYPYAKVDISFEVPATIETIEDYLFRDINQLTTITFENGSIIKTIGDSAFSGTSIQSITLPASLENISANAFNDMANLNEILVDEANAFYSSIDGVLFNKDLTVLINYPKTKTNTSFTIPSSVEIIEDNAFNGASHLTEVLFEENSSLTTIGESAFRDTNLITIEIPSSVTTISHHAFAYIDTLTTVNFIGDSSLETIGSYAFYGTKIETLLIPSTVTLIGDGAFKLVTTLTSLTFEDNSQLKSIGNSAFSYTSIESLVIPASVTEINGYAFSDVYAMTSLIFEDNSELEYIGSYAFEWISISSLEIPASVITIDDNAFVYNKSLLNLSFEDGSNLKYIGREAFGETAISSLVIPASVLEIREYAFNDIPLLTSVTFEEGSLLKKIGHRAFAYTQLINITLPRHLEFISPTAFDDINTLVEVNVEDGNTHLQSINGVLYDFDISIILIYPKAKTETSFEVPATVTRLLSHSFNNALTSITFEEGSQLEIIDSYAFYPSSITTINIPESVHTINENGLYNSNLEEVHIDEENLYYTSIDGVVYNKDMTEIIYYPGSKSGTTFTIPATVKVIKTRAFSENKELRDILFEENSSLYAIETYAFSDSFIETIELPDTLKYILDSAFSRTNLSYVFIPINVEYIARYAFYTNSDLVIDIEAQDGMITLEYNWCNSYYTTVNYGASRD